MWNTRRMLLRTYHAQLKPSPYQKNNPQTGRQAVALSSREKHHILEPMAKKLHTFGKLKLLDKNALARREK